MCKTFKREVNKQKGSVDVSSVCLHELFKVRVFKRKKKQHTISLKNHCLYQKTLRNVMLMFKRYKKKE